MKTLFAILIILFIISCNTNSELKDNSLLGRQWNIVLQNNLGTINLILPNRLDTFISWNQTSDCGDGCTHIDYRVQRKIMPIFKESGFYYLPLMDSVDQFTIKHMKLSYPENQMDSGSLENLKFLSKSKLPSLYPIKTEIDTNFLISGKQFSVFGYSTFDSIRKTTYYSLNAMTAINRNIIELYFEYRVRHFDSASTNFIANSFEYLKTIKINGR
jgi:hypothetical protein